MLLVITNISKRQEYFLTLGNIIYSIMTFKELCLRRQACRKYLPKAIEQEKLDYILECARLAPSACNRQPWTVYLLQSEDAVSKATECYNRDWAKTAPMFILLCIKEDQQWIRPNDNKPHGMIDISIIAEHICIAATEVGLDTCWVCNFETAKAQAIFSIPEDETPAVLIPIGYSEEAVREKTRKEMDEILIIK